MTDFPQDGDSTLKRHKINSRRNRNTRSRGIRRNVNRARVETIPQVGFDIDERNRKSRKDFVVDDRFRAKTVVSMGNVVKGRRKIMTQMKLWYENLNRPHGLTQDKK